MIKIILNTLLLWITSSVIISTVLLLLEVTNPLAPKVLGCLNGIAIYVLYIFPATKKHKETKNKD